MQPSRRPSETSRDSERGNMLFMILIAVVLIGLLTAVIMSTSNSESANIDKETLVIRVSEAQRTAAEFERAVMFIVGNGRSESDIRFAHPAAHADYGTLTDEPDRQVFHPQGGGASFRPPPEDINDGSQWEFYAGTAIPGVGTGKADLIAVLPNVTGQFCAAVNEMNNQPAVTPEDTGVTAAGGINPGDCLSIGAVGRFDAAQQFYAAPNTVDETTFRQDPNTTAASPALQACVKCDIGPVYHFYQVLLAR